MVHIDDFNYIISVENLIKAWKEFRRGKMNRQDVLEFDFNLMDNVTNLHYELERQKYKSRGYIKFCISDPKPRIIHKASVRDRVVHQAIYRTLYDTFDMHFIHDSYSCRKYKGTHRGVQRVGDFIRKATKNYRNNCWYLKLDIEKFFDNIDHYTLKGLLLKYIPDDRTFNLLNTVINSFEKQKDKGLPLGNVTSQLFANVYMNKFDQFIKHELKIKYYVRYADDFVILHQDREFLVSLVDRIRYFLREHLKLNIHEDKIIIKKASQGIDFLGYVSLPHYRILRTRTKRRIFHKTRSNNNCNSIQSYIGITKHCCGNRIRCRLEKLL